MNRDRYRLVFDPRRAMPVPVSEIAGTPGRRQSAGRRPRRAGLLAALLLPALPALGLDPATLPRGGVVLPGASGALPATLQTPVALPGGGQQLNIHQAAHKAIIQWQGFNVGRASEVIFHHPDSKAATLNRVVQVGKEHQSIIEGGLRSLVSGTQQTGGAIYIINQNGILFGNGAQVNVGGLVASALDIDDAVFLGDNGHLGPGLQNKAAYQWKGDRAGFLETLVQVEPEASIKAAAGGSVMLFAPRVLNQGDIQTQEGQVVLAAGAKVYLTVAPDPNAGASSANFVYPEDSPYRGLAGVLVEVDPYPADADNPAPKGGETVNDALGRILAARGNVTLAGLTVNQNGRVTATTSVRHKGSIRLLARDTFGGGEKTRIVDTTTGQESEFTVNTSATRLGELKLGEDSLAQVLPEHPLGEAIARQHLPADAYRDDVIAALRLYGDKPTTLAGDQLFNPSSVEGIGRRVILEDRAKVVAPGGHVNFEARLDPVLGAQASRLYLGRDTRIDVSGLDGVSVDMARNFIEVLLTANDLADSSLNKDGFLYRKKVWFDIRDLPDSRLVNLAGYLKDVQRDVGEKLAAGGSVRLRSEGDLIQRVGSRIDVSGGSLRYGEGLHHETVLVDAAGNRFAIGEAPADRVYTAFADIYSATDSKYGVTTTRTFYDREAGYSEGLAAGSVDLVATALALDGSILGAAEPGPYQREGVSLAGRLSIGDKTASGRSADFYTPAIDIGAAPNRLADDFTADSPLSAHARATLWLDSAMLNASGLGHLTLYANDGIRLLEGGGLRLADGGSVGFTAYGIEVLDDITVHGGGIRLSSQLNRNLADYARTGVRVGRGARLDASGLWTNDRLPGSDPASAIRLKGGSITIKSAGGVTVEQDSTLNVSGGGWYSAAGKLSPGDAGSITLETNLGQTSAELRFDPLRLNGQLLAYALGKGGGLTLNAPFLTLGNSGVDADGRFGEFVATPEFFTRGGFTRYSLAGRDGVLLRENTVIQPIARNWQLDSDFILRPSGTDLTRFSRVVDLGASLRTPVSLSLAAGKSTLGQGLLPAGMLRAEAGAHLKVDAGGALALSTSAENSRLEVHGTLEAPAGEIRLSLGGDLGEGYDPTQVLWLGSRARLLAPGAVRFTPNAQGLRQGTVLDGGRIVVEAEKGYLVAERGALLDVGGVSGVFDLLVPGPGGFALQPTRVSGNGGAITLKAREGLLSDATFLAQAPGARAGSLSLTLSRGNQGSPDLASPPYPGSPGFHAERDWRIVLDQSGDQVPGGLDLGESVDAAAPGRARIALDAIQAGGFAEVSLIAEHGIEFAGPASLTTARAIRLDAPEIIAGGNLTLNTGYLRLANAETGVRQSGLTNDYAPVTPTPGTWTWTANAELIEIQGHVALSGFKHATFDSSGDIRLLGLAQNNTRPTGSLTSAGDLAFTARQVYPGGYSSFTLQSLESRDPEGRIQGTVSFAGRGGHDPVLTAGGALLVKAPYIRQGGVLKAPFGRIELAAGESLELLAGSLTSVSAAGRLLPFGATERTGLDWLYDYGLAKAPFQAPPERTVALSGMVVTQSDGGTPDDPADDAVVDLSGSAGGDLFAYEWLPGIGGSADPLAESYLYPRKADGSLDKTAQAANLKAFGANTTGVWAILPEDNAAWGHYDTQYYLGSPLAAGQAVYLSGLPDLPAGYYTLLPARYALLPGARLVTAVSGNTDLAAGAAMARPDGAWLVSGRLAARVHGGWADTGRSGGFTVRDGAAVARLAEYQGNLGSDYFADATTAQQTGDAGRLSVTARRSMKLAGRILADHASGRRGADVDLAAPYLAALAPGKAAPFQDADGDGRNDYVLLDVTQLQKLNAASLMLGGSRSARENGVAVNVTASQVRVDNDAEQALAASEILLVAKDTVSVSSTSVLRGEGTAGGVARDIEIGALDGDGDGALLRLASGGQARVVRRLTDRDRGVLRVESGALLAADGAINLDASRDNRSEGDLKLAEGGGLALSASRISLGEPAGDGQVAEGLVLGKKELDDLARNLSGGGELTLRSYSGIDLYGAVALHSPGLKLSLEAGGLAGYDNAGQTATLNLARLTLGNPSGSTWSVAPALKDGRVPAPGGGTLKVDAGELRTGVGELSVRGYGDLTLGARQRIVATAAGAGNSLTQVDGGLTLSTPQVTAEGRAEHSFIATQALVIDKHPLGEALQPAPPTANAKLVFKGSQLTQKSRVELPSGRIEMEASGTAAADHVILAAGSETLAPGQSRAIFEQAVPLPAGSVGLTSAAGDVVLEGSAVDANGVITAPAARIDLSGVAGGDAGRLTVSAVKGRASLTGVVEAANPADTQGKRGEGGRVSLDVGAVANLSDIARVLTDFNRQWQLRARTGALALDAGAVIVSRDVLLAADAGDLTVRGSIDASGAEAGGRIELAAAGDVVLERQAGAAVGGTLRAVATEDTATGVGTAGRGGVVVLDARDGRVKVKAGTTIDVSGEHQGTVQGEDGEVLLRAQRDAVGVRIDKIEGEISGARAIIAEAVRVYEKVGNTTIASIGSGTSSGNKLGMTSVQTDTTNYMLNAADILNSLTRDTPLQGDAKFHLRPGVEVRVPGNLTLSSDWNLQSLRFAGEPGNLTLRTAGNLAMDASLSDGFSTVLATTGALQSGDSWSYRLVAGADLDAAHGLAVKSGQGDFTLANGKLVRTGTGDISVAAGRDIVFGGDTAVIYTAGEPGPTVANFTLPAKVKTADLAAVYPWHGGDLVLSARGNVKGRNSAATSDTRLNDWLTRAVPSTTNTGVYNSNPRTSLWARFDYFKHGVGALGGGDVSVTAGGDVSDLWVSSVANFRLTGPSDQAPAESGLVWQGGGNVSVTAGGDIRDALLFAGNGRARAAADGDATLRFALMQAGASVRAAGDIEVKSVFNPTVTAIDATGSGIPAGSSKLAYRVYFDSYGKDSSLAVHSTSGKVTLGGSGYYPSRVNVTSALGDVSIDGIVMRPASDGDLVALAGGSLQTKGLILSDYDPALLRTLFNPLPVGIVNPSGSLPPISLYKGSLYHPETALHGNDPEPVRLYALDDVKLGVGSPVVLAKRAWIKAGGDVVDPNLVIQNLHDYDTSLIQALGSVRYAEPSRDGSGNINIANVGVTIAGPGRLHVVAGRDVDLGSSNGILSVGDAFNPFLSGNGATVMLWAGAAGGMDQAGFMAAYLEASGANRVALTDYMRTRSGVAGLDEEQAMAAFKALSELDRTAFLIAVLYRELAASGRAALDPADASFGDYSAGERAMLRLFPALDGDANLADQPGSIMAAFEALGDGPAAHPGDLKLFYSQVRSERGGGIEILVPGGLVNAGLASATGINKPASQLGIVSARGGSIRALARNDFLVNQSRVFTLAGDDILLWSALADIDAGRGAKTASATPPPVLRLKNGEIVLDYSASVSGSGIAALLAVEGAEPGSVDLFAPYGEINAGEAGIRSAGNINLGARMVVGADLIVAGGVATGAPAADAGGLGGALSGVSNLGDSTKATDDVTRSVGASAQDGDKNAQQAKQALAGFRPTFLTVEVLGFGDGSASIDDEAERRRRQQEARLREQRG